MSMVVQNEEATTSLPAGYEAQGSLAVSLARAEVDQQIATARAMPRSITRAVKNITTLATLDEQSAEECIYALPRGGKPIKGPSVRLAEIIASQWGNCRVGARVVHVDRFEKFVEAEGVFHDLETNTATTARVRRRISDKNGRVFNDDMIVVTGNAACAIAKRNAVLGGVPKAVWRKAYEEVEAVILGDVKTLAERRARALGAFGGFGVTPEQIFAALGVAGEDDIDLQRLGTLTAMRAGLKNGECTVEEMFPKPDAKGAAPKGLSAKLDALATPAANDPPHDPETGEIVETAKGSAADKPAPAPQEPDWRKLLAELAADFERAQTEDDLLAESEAAQQAWFNDAPKAIRMQAEDLFETYRKRICAPKLIKADAPAPFETEAADVGAQTLDDDPKLTTLIAAARAKAAEGSAKLKFYMAKITPPDFDRLKPHLPALREQAAEADAAKE